MDKTREVIASMLTERVATSFLDSGGTPHYDADGNYTHSSSGYGRHFERNRGRNFERELATRLDFSYKEISVSHNVYHWLVEHLDYDEDMNRLFLEVFLPIAEKEEQKYWSDLMPGFLEWLGQPAAWVRRKADDKRKFWHCGNGNCGTLAEQPQDWRCPTCHEHTRKVVQKYCAECDRWIETGDWDRHCRNRHPSENSEVARALHGAGLYDAFFEALGEKPGGLYGEGEPLSEYTYNVENCLSQDIVFTLFTWQGTEYVFLQIHNGADARGGFTDPVIFSTHDDSFLSYADATIWCEDGDHSWYTDQGGYHWYYNGPRDEGQNLEKYERVDLDDLTEEQEAELAEVNGHNSRVNEYEGQPELWGGERPYFDLRPPFPGRLVVDENGYGYCPICGGKLTAGW